MAAARKLASWDFFRAIGSPQFVCAPMVDQSELAFRLLCRRHGTTLCYTPMYHARRFVESEAYRREKHGTCAEDRPLVVQLCGNDPATLLAAGRLVEHECDAVDLNLGCPQGIARRGHYGAFLLTELALLHDIVSTLHEGLAVPVTCKIRVLDTWDETIALATTLVEAGCQLLTVHGRTKENKKQVITAADWDIIRRLKQELPVPVVANGGIANYEDVHRCLAETGVDAVMSSEGLLNNPAIFAPPDQQPSAGELALEYLAIVREEVPDTPLKWVRAHVFKLLNAHLQLEPQLRPDLARARSLDDVAGIVAQALRAGEQRPLELREAVPFYYRHQWSSYGVPKTPQAAAALAAAEAGVSSASALASSALPSPEAEAEAEQETVEEGQLDAMFGED